MSPITRFRLPSTFSLYSVGDIILASYILPGHRTRSKKKTFADTLVNGGMYLTISEDLSAQAGRQWTFTQLIICLNQPSHFMASTLGLSGNSRSTCTTAPQRVACCLKQYTILSFRRSICISSACQCAFPLSSPSISTANINFPGNIPLWLPTKIPLSYPPKIHNKCGVQCRKYKTNTDRVFE